MTIAAEVEHPRDGRATAAADANRFVGGRRRQERRRTAESPLLGDAGGVLKYRQKCDEVAALGDEGSRSVDRRLRRKL